MKEPRTLIKEGRKEIKSLMQSYLTDIASNIISQIVRKAKQATPATLMNSTKNIDLPVGAKYKIALREAVAVVVSEAINLAKEEVPARVTFSEFQDLPPKIKRFLDAQTSLYVETQIEDLHKKLGFSFQDAARHTSDVEIISKELSNEAATYAESTSVAAASSKLVATAVNNARQAYFDIPEVMEKIEAFQYINPVPNAAICIDLQNHVFRADDPELAVWTPPFHFNCDGWLRPILVGNLRGREPQKYNPTKKARQSVQFSEQERRPKS